MNRMQGLHTYTCNTVHTCVDVRFVNMNTFLKNSKTITITFLLHTCTTVSPETCATTTTTGGTNVPVDQWCLLCVHACSTRTFNLPVWTWPTTGLKCFVIQVWKDLSQR